MMAFNEQPQNVKKEGGLLARLPLPPTKDNNFDQIQLSMYIVAIAPNQTTPMTIVGVSENLAPTISKLLYSYGKKKTDLVRIKFPGLTVELQDSLTKQGYQFPKGSLDLCNEFKKIHARGELAVLPNE